MKRHSTAASPESAAKGVRLWKRRCRTALTDTKDPDVLDRVDERLLQPADSCADNLRSDAWDLGNSGNVLTCETSNKGAEVLRVEPELQDTRSDLSRQFMREFAGEDGGAWRAG
jgi:hypothetical protein